ncbi:MAG: zinc dependent phospholipase C family protein [Eubacteriales bacterium]|nr:zinc dependent phospholipase C family protein [Eubacteriales bacterium]
MPTTYAHDLFGKMVYHRVNEELQRLILQHKTAYQIGLHGPDILFYVRPFHKNRINELGQRMHEEQASVFFRHAKKIYAQTKDPNVLAYLMGFVCHFMLDSTCHPYISEFMKITCAGHDEIETELDRELMVRTEKNPFHYLPASVIQTESRSVQAIASVLEGISEKEVRQALRGIQFYTGITVCNRPWKRCWLLNLAKLAGIYPLVQGRVMRRLPREYCKKSTEELCRMFYLTVPETVTVLEEFYRYRDDPEELCCRFNRNFI